MLNVLHYAGLSNNHNTKDNSFSAISDQRTADKIHIKNTRMRISAHLKPIVQLKRQIQV